MALELKASKLYFKYNADWILQDISFSVNPGEFLGIIGPNGSGKTTLIKLLDGILFPQQGYVELNGVNLAELKRNWIAQRIAVVSPGLSLDFSFNVLQLVLMGRYPYLDNLRFEGKRDYQIAEEAMALTDVADFAERYFHELSGGERQRVLLARALAQEPELLLLDEPTVYLDINHTIDFFDLVKRMNRERGLTVVVVSHDINLAADYCNKLILLNQGKIFYHGRPQEVITNQNIQSVYGKRVLVEQHPSSGFPRIIINPA